MLGAVYGLQAFIFILKREFMLVGWMIIYILAYGRAPLLPHTVLTLFQLSRLQFLLTDLFVLVHGRLQLG